MAQWGPVRRRVEKLLDRPVRPGDSLLMTLEALCDRLEAADRRRVDIVELLARDEQAIGLLQHSPNYDECVAKIHDTTLTRIRDVLQREKP